MSSGRKNKSRVPVVNLDPGRELSAEQIVQVANGAMQILVEGDKVGTALPPRYRALFIGAIALRYLKYSRRQAQVVEVFSCWCEAKKVPCVSFEIKDDCLDMLSDNDSTHATEPFVTIHFDVATTDRAFSKAGLLAVADLLLGPLWDLTLSPLKVSAGVMPFNIAHRMMVQVFQIWDTTSNRNSDGVAFDEKSTPPGPRTIH